MAIYTSCTDCGTSDPARLYLSHKMPRCYDCQRFANLSTKKTGGGVSFTREEFLAWLNETPNSRICAYCGIDRDGLFALGIVNPRNKRLFESIGVDRRDNSKGYSLDNLVPCCGPCNAMRGSILTHEEMLELGPCVRGFWESRALASL